MDALAVADGIVPPHIGADQDVDARDAGNVLEGRSGQVRDLSLARHLAHDVGCEQEHADLPGGVAPRHARSAGGAKRIRRGRTTARQARRMAKMRAFGRRIHPSG